MHVGGVFISTLVYCHHVGKQEWVTPMRREATRLQSAMFDWIHEQRLETTHLVDSCTADIPLACAWIWRPLQVPGCCLRPPFLSCCRTRRTPSTSSFVVPILSARDRRVRHAARQYIIDPSLAASSVSCRSPSTSTHDMYISICPYPQTE